MERISRILRTAWSWSGQKWSAPPDTWVWTLAPPRSSAEITSPVAAFTSGGPPRNEKDILSIITASVAMKTM